jgi:UDP-N-acetylmuramoylalanine--D-glutamate ligase
VNKWGVWGLGTVGKSVLSFLAKKNYFLSVMDKRLPTANEQEFLDKHTIKFFLQSESRAFFEANNKIVISPGIDRSAAHEYQAKFVEEIDLFCNEWKKPLIAVTGSVGKTSIVHLLHQILQANGVEVAMGGNIGKGMLDLLHEQDRSSYALLELSSFQLENSVHCTPDLALWTNLYPNHLDRHGSLENYLLAKHKMIKHQKDPQKSLIPWKLAHTIQELSPDRSFCFFSAQMPSHLDTLRKNDILYSFLGTDIVKMSAGSLPSLVISGSKLHAVQFLYAENVLLLMAACDQLGIINATFTLPSLSIPHHRMELVATIKGVNFYNDSKSTILEASIAAISSLKSPKNHLILGGISKGVDRTKSLTVLQNKVSSIICFGSEAEILHQAAREANIPAACFNSLEDALKHAMEEAQFGETIVFSPGGASFDLYANYQERGDHFKVLVNKFMH